MFITVDDIRININNIISYEPHGLKNTYFSLNGPSNGLDKLNLAIKIEEVDALIYNAQHPPSLMAAEYVEPSYDEVMVADEDAIQRNTSLMQLVNEKKLEGYYVHYEYNHEAIGHVVVMRKPI